MQGRGGRGRGAKESAAQGRTVSQPPPPGGDEARPDGAGAGPAGQAAVEDGEIPDGEK